MENVLPIFPPRPLTDGERQLLLDWTAETKAFFAFVSERRNDDPMIYRRIVVSRRATKQPLYLIHCHKNFNLWIMVSVVDGEDVGRFPTLRAALNCISPVTASARGGGPPNDDNSPAMQFEWTSR